MSQFNVPKSATQLGLKLTKYHTGIGRGGYYRYAVYEGEERPYSSISKHVLFYFDAEHSGGFHRVAKYREKEVFELLKLELLKIPESRLRKLNQNTSA